jgi:hypothetical protein
LIQSCLYVYFGELGIRVGIVFIIDWFVVCAIVRTNTIKGRILIVSFYRNSHTILSNKSKYKLEEADNYEYGAVDAPIGIAWGAGVLVILSALLPLAMQGGEEAFEEMKDQESDTWGSGNSNRLNKKK